MESNRTSMITVTRAELSKDSRRAVVFFTVFPTDTEKGALDFLKRNRGTFRDYLLKNIKTGRIPTIDFEIDIGEKNRERIEEISRS